MDGCSSQIHGWWRKNQQTQGRERNMTYGDLCGQSLALGAMKFGVHSTTKNGDSHEGGSSLGKQDCNIGQTGSWLQELKRSL